MKINVIKLFNKLADDVGLDPFDRHYCISRIKSEGIQFLTVTLPKLSKSVLVSLELGYFERPTCFAWKGRSLRYFRSLLSQIFDRNGKVSSTACPYAIKRIRQLCEYTYKLCIPYKEDVLVEAESKFIANEEALAAAETDYKFVDQLRKDVGTFFKDLQTYHFHDAYKFSRPRFGPGTFSGNVRDFYKYKEYVKSYNLDKFKHSSGYFKPYPSAPVKTKTIRFDTNNVSELLFVPKDSRGPRTIVREPLHALRSQLSFFDFITNYLENKTGYRINFKSQDVNKHLALSSSIDKEFSTLDLKDASDMVDFKIIEHIFRETPLVSYFLKNTRTSDCVTPSGHVLKLRKLAGMGSGLTFPLMSFLIYLSIVRCCSTRFRIPYHIAMKKVYVYGDDVIVPTRWFNCALSALKKVKLKVNTEKSFTNSLFRESCGGDYYNGVEVAPVRLKCSNTDNSVVNGELVLKGSQTLLTLERHCRELVKSSMINTSEYIYSIIERKYGSLPIVTGESPVIGRYSIDPITYPTDNFGNYITKKVIVPVAESVGISNTCPYWHLSKFFSKKSEITFDIEDFLNVSTNGSTFGTISVPRSIRYKSVKCSAFRLMG